MNAGVCRCRTVKGIDNQRIRFVPRDRQAVRLDLLWRSFARVLISGSHLAGSAGH